MTGAHHVVPPRVFVTVGALLMVLLGVTAAVAEIDLGPFSIVVALAVALVKAALVILYFMEVRWSSRLVWVFSAAGFFWLLILIALTMADVLARPAGSVVGG